MASFRPGVVALCLCTFWLQDQARAEGSTLIISRDRLDQKSVPAPDTASAPPEQPASRMPPKADSLRFVLSHVEIEGRSSLEPALIEATYRDLIGKSITGRDAYAIADAIAVIYRKKGYALYAVLVPDQDFAQGIVRLRIVEGHIRQVSIAGDNLPHGMRLVQSYVAPATAERPLKRATLERALLLLNRIPGLSVSSRLTPASVAPGAADLSLSMSRKAVELGASVDNHGTQQLGRLQFELNLGVNAILQQGDRTDLTYSFPSTPARFQYVGLSHTIPIGTDGTIMQPHGAALFTHPKNPDPHGTAYAYGVQFNHPFILGTRETLFGLLSFDLLNSKSALFGDTIANERVRSLRAGLQYAAITGSKSLDSAAFVISEGIDALGARQNNPQFGGSSFTKINLHVAHEQSISSRIQIRMKAAVQYAFDLLPSSEQFTYGGDDFGRGFETGTFIGDRGVTASLEAAYRVKLPYLAVSPMPELFAFADSGWVWRMNGLIKPAELSASSAGAGFRFNVTARSALEILVAHPVATSEASDGQNGWRFLIGIQSAI